jgi:shikimate 5-dehydrogenase
MVGVAGFTPNQKLTCRLMNAAFAHLNMNTRCLPMEVGNLGNFDRMMDGMRVTACVLDKAYWANILSVVQRTEEAAKVSRHADVAIKHDTGWVAYNTLWRATVLCLEETLKKAGRGDEPLKGRSVLLAGATSAARALAYGVQGRGGLLTVTGPDSEKAGLLAQMFECRFVPLQRCYDTMYDVLVVAPSETDVYGNSVVNFDPSYLRSEATVLDLDRIPEETPIVAEARARGCLVVEPLEVYLSQTAQRLRALTGADVPLEVLREAMPH